MREKILRKCWMVRSMKIDDALLSRAARIVRDRELAALPHEDLCPEHVFSEKYEQEIKEIIDKLERGEMEQIVPPMGWRYYVRNGIAAVLIAFFLTCVAAPEAVVAAYQKLVEVIETVVTEYTEYRYIYDGNTEGKFQPVTFGYLPENNELESSLLQEYRYHVHYNFGNDYLNLEQIILTKEEKEKVTIMVDTENADLEIRHIYNDKIQFILNKNVYRYIWIHDKYIIKGQSSLSVDEIMKILEDITFE